MILVTTPNGKVGSEVVRQLLAKGAQVRVGAHTVAKAEREFPTAAVVHLDFNDADSVAAALQGVSALYLASPGEGDTAPVNAVVDAAVAAGVERIVRLSAMGVEQGESPMREVERHVEASGMAWTLLRPNWFFQNFSTGQAGTIREQGAIFEPADDGATSFIDTRDIAAVAVAALTEDGHAGQAYTLTGGRAYNRTEVAAAIAEATGKPVQYVPISSEQFITSMAGAGASPDFVHFMVFLYDGIRAGWTTSVTDTVERLTGQAPRTLEQFAQDHREAWV